MATRTKKKKQTWTAWIRVLDNDTMIRNKWVSKYQFPNIEDCLTWVEEYCVNREGVSGIVLPDQETPEGMCSL